MRGIHLLLWQLGRVHSFSGRHFLGINSHCKRPLSVPKSAHSSSSPNNQFSIGSSEFPSSDANTKQTALLWLAHNRLRTRDNLALTKAAELGPDGLAICILWPYGNFTTSLEITPAEAFGYAAVHALSDALEKFGQKLCVIPSTVKEKDNSLDRDDPVLAVAQAVHQLQPTYVVVDVSSLDAHLDNASRLEKVLEESKCSESTVVNVMDDALLLPFDRVPKALGRSRQGGRALRWSTFLTNAMMMQKETQTDGPCWELKSLPPPIDKSNDFFGFCELPPKMEELPTWTRQLLLEWGEITESEAILRANRASYNTSISTFSKLTEEGSKDSKLSPYLRWGIISPQMAVKSGVRRRDLLWRDWSYVCYRLLGPLRRGDAVLEFLDKRMNSIKTSDKEQEQERFHMWCVGNTGCQMVDAGMRQLWHDGWIPRKIRLLAACCLVEGLGVNYRLGKDWFEYTLIDHDPAINEMMWQNAGICGVDPFYRGIKWEAPPNGECEKSYVQYWLSKELVWPPTLNQYAAQESSSEFVDKAQLRRDVLANNGVYRTAKTVENSGVRVAWPGLNASFKDDRKRIDDGEVMGVGLVHVDELKVRQIL